MTLRRSVGCIAALMLTAGAAHAQFGVGSSFTYQGQLNVSGQPASGAYDIQFRLLDSHTGGAQIGSTLTFTNVNVTKGLFTKQLDFGAASINGYARWLEVSVRPAGSGSYTVLSPLQALSATPYALGLSLPCTENGNTAGPLLNLFQANSGSSAAIAGTIQNGYGAALYGQASGAGSTGVWGYNLATSGYAGYFRSENPNNTSPTLRVEGMGGVAGDFEISAFSSTSAAVWAEHAGAGPAGQFVVSNPSSIASSIIAKNEGNGRAGLFQITTPNNSSPAIEASTIGTGYAAKFTGPALVTGNLTTGSITKSFGAGGQHPAAPIAYGAFTPYTTGTTLVSSSGNVSLSYLGNNTYRLTVSGASAPSSWIVTANIAYGNPENPGITYAVRPGIADASGRIPIYAPCDSNCGGFGGAAQVNFVVYQP